MNNMINNPTPEDKESTYQQKLEKNADAFKWLILIVSALTIMGGSIYACHEMKAPKLLTPATKIDTTTFSTRATSIKAVDSLSAPGEDSIVFRNNKISLLMYHQGRVVAMRPNKTWHWLVLDSAGYKITIVKAKRRDSL